MLKQLMSEQLNRQKYHLYKFWWVQGAYSYHIMRVVIRMWLYICLNIYWLTLKALVNMFLLQPIVSRETSYTQASVEIQLLSHV